MAGCVAVAGELGAEFVDAAEFEFEAEEFDELEGDGFAVDVAVEVEDVHFHRELCAVVEGGAHAHVHHALVPLIVHFHHHGVSAFVGKNEVGGDFAHVGGGEAYATAVVEAVN